MNQLTYLVSIKTFFEKDNDYISAFSYIVLQVLTEYRQENIQIQKKINQHFSINMPVPIIKTCLKRLQKLGITSAERSSLSERGKEVLQNINNEIENANREINFLIEKIQIHIQQLNIHVTNEDVRKSLIWLIESKTQDLASGFKNIQISSESTHNSPLIRGIVHFLIDSEAKDPQSFKILRDIGQGIILHSILSKENPDKLGESFSALTVFLDTNIVFGLLKLANPETNTACVEMIKLIQQQKHIEIHLFPFTVDEIRNFIEAEIRSRDSLNTSYQYLTGARKILSKKSITDLKTLQDNFARDLNKNFGIIVSTDYAEELWTDEEVQSLNKMKTDLESLYKTPSKASLEHDINAYQWIKRLRKSKVYSIEDAKYLFLTLDNKLFRWVAQKHQTSRPEVITMDAFTAVLWIKTPNLNSNLPIHNLIAGCREKILIRKDVWDVIINTLKKYKNLDDYTHDPLSIQLLQSRSILEQIEGKYEISEDEAKQYIEKAETDILQQIEKDQQTIDSLKQDKENMTEELNRSKNQNQDSQNQFQKSQEQLNYIVSFISGFLAYIVGLMGLVLLYILCFSSFISQDFSLNLFVIQLNEVSFWGRVLLNLIWIIIFLFYLKGKIKSRLIKQILNHLSHKSYVSTK